jgi:hypothetical protein
LFLEGEEDTINEAFFQPLRNVSGSKCCNQFLDNLKDESEPYRKMTVETVEKLIAALGAADISERLEDAHFLAQVHCGIDYLAVVSSIERHTSHPEAFEELSSTT